MLINGEQKVSGRIFKCIYCGNEIFSAADDDLDLIESPSFFSPKKVTNVRGEDDKFSSDIMELFCRRCGLSVGYKLIDRSELIGDRNYIRVNMLEMSSDLQAVA